MSSSSLYEILNVKSNCSSADITKAWLFIQTSIPRSNSRFHLAKTAYDTLSDPVKREIYDSFNVSDFTAKDAIDNNFHFSSSCLDAKEVQQLVGKLRTQSSQHHIEVRLSLADVYSGKTVDVKTKASKHCTECKNYRKLMPCPHCASSRGALTSLCSLCMNSRKVFVSQKCLVCHDKKIISVDANTKVVIKPGTCEGQKLRCIDGITEIVLRQAPHQVFRRYGDDLFMKKQINIAQSLCGIRFVIKHLDGRQLLVTSPVGSVLPPGCRKVIPREGMPIAGFTDGRRGDLIIIFHIRVPNSLPAEQAREIETLLPKRPVFKMPENPETEEYNLTEFDPNFKILGIPKYDEAYFDDRQDKNNSAKASGRCAQQ